MIPSNSSDETKSKLFLVDLASGKSVSESNATSLPTGGAIEALDARIGVESGRRVGLWSIRVANEAMMKLFVRIDLLSS